MSKIKVFPVCILIFCTKAIFSQPVINEILSSNITGIEDESDLDEQNCPVPDCEWWFERMGETVLLADDTA